MRKKPSRKSAGSGAGFLLPANLRIAALLDKFWPLSTFGQNHTNSRGSSLSRATRSYPVLFRAVQSCAWLSRKLSKNYPKLSKTIPNFLKLSKPIPNYPKLLTEIAAILGKNISDFNDSGLINENISGTFLNP